MLFFFFFFQAEDGIRDLVRSRGLGDVYKRQDIAVSALGERLEPDHVVLLVEPCHKARGVAERVPVSYTHLTLPTSDLV